jgi:hypothetical protein
MRQWVMVTPQRMVDQVNVGLNGALPVAHRWHKPISMAAAQTDAVVVTNASCFIWRRLGRTGLSLYFCSLPVSGLKYRNQSQNPHTTQVPTRSRARMGHIHDHDHVAAAPPRVPGYALAPVP